MVTRLANILRYNLQRERSSTVPLSQEIEIVSDYLAIESIRFDDRLTLSAWRSKTRRCPRASALDADPDAGRKRGQTRHREQKRGRRNRHPRIDQERRRVGDAKSSTPVNLATPNGSTTQIGLTNARERLRLLYGGKASLKLENRDPATVIAALEYRSRYEIRHRRR